MAGESRNPDDYCYRHPDRLSFVLCEKCARTICLECQNHVHGRTLCPDDAAQSLAPVTPITANGRKRRRVPRQRRVLVAPDVPVVTYSLMAILVVVFLVDSLLGRTLIYQMVLLPGAAKFAPWTVFTSMFGEGGGSDGLLGLAFDCLVIYFLGRSFERTIGRLKFAGLFVGSGLGASLFAVLFGGGVFGAGSAVFGLVAAAVVLYRVTRGGNLTWIYFSIGISLLQIVLSSSRAILWQAALGALVTGGALMYLYIQEGSDASKRNARITVGGIGVLLIIGAVVRAAAIG